MTVKTDLSTLRTLHHQLGVDVLLNAGVAEGMAAGELLRLAVVSVADEAIG